MAANDNTIKNVLQWSVDRGSVASTVQANNSVGKSIGDIAANANKAYEARVRELSVAKQSNSLSSSVAAANSAYEQRVRELNDAADATLRLKRATDDAGQEYDELSRSTARAAANASKVASSGGGRIGSVLENADRFGSVGSQIFGGLGNSQLANTAGLIGDVAGGFASLNPLLLATTAAGAGFTIILGDIQRQMEATRKEAELYASKTATNAELIASGATTADVQALIADKRPAADYITTTLEQLNGFRDELGQYSDVFANLSSPERQARIEAIGKQIEGITGQPFDDIGQLTAQIQALGAEGAKYGASILNYNQLINSNALAANDAAAAHKANEEAVEGFIDTFKDRFKDGLTNVAGGVSDFFQDAAKSAEEARKAAAESDTTRNNSYLAALQSESDARTKALAAEQKIIDAQADEDTATAKARADSIERISDIEARAGDQRAELAQDREDKVNKIVKDAGREFAEAIGDRDADAFRRSNITAKDALEEQALNDKRRTEQIDKTTTAQLATEKKAGDERVRIASMSADRTIATLTKEVNDQYFIAERARASIDFLTTNSMNNAVNTTANGFRAIEQNFSVGLNNIANLVQSRLAGVLSGSYNTQQAPSLSSTLGQYYGMTQQQFNNRFDNRLDGYLSAAQRGGRTIVA